MITAPTSPALLTGAADLLAQRGSTTIATAVAIVVGVLLILVV